MGAVLGGVRKVTFRASFPAVNLILKALFIYQAKRWAVSSVGVEMQAVKLQLSSSSLSVLFFIGLGVVCLMCWSALITSSYAVWSSYINVAFVSFFLILECGRNGNIGLHWCGTKEMATEHRCLGRLLFFCSYVYFRLSAVKGGFFAGCVKGEPKAVLQKLAGSFLWCRQIRSVQKQKISFPRNSVWMS